MTSTDPEHTRVSEASPHRTDARACACLLVGLASIFTLGAGSLASIGLWAQVFFPVKWRDRYRLAASYIASIGVILGVIGLVYLVYVVRNVARCPGEPGANVLASSDSLDLILVLATFLGPSLLGLLAVLLERALARSRLRWVPVTMLGVLSLAAAGWAWVVLLFAVMGECFA